jgi:hypothetical protein
VIHVTTSIERLNSYGTMRARDRCKHKTPWLNEIGKGSHSRAGREGSGYQSAAFGMFRVISSIELAEEDYLTFDETAKRERMPARARGVSAEHEGPSSSFKDESLDDSVRGGVHCNTRTYVYVCKNTGFRVIVDFRR